MFAPGVSVAGKSQKELAKLEQVSRGPQASARAGGGGCPCRPKGGYLLILPDIYAVCDTTELLVEGARRSHQATELHVRCSTGPAHLQLVCDLQGSTLAMIVPAKVCVLLLCSMRWQLPRLRLKWHVWLNPNPKP